MIWSDTKRYFPEPYELERELEAAILEVQGDLFSSERIYVDTKKMIGVKGKQRNIPDGYLIDLTSIKEPKLYVVENELALHDPLRHIAVQILQLSLSFETAPQRVKTIVKDALETNHDGMKICKSYAETNGYGNVDYLLESMVFDQKAFNALVIIDEMAEDLETVLLSKFKFPVEVLTIKRYKSKDGERAYEFTPFLDDVAVDAPKGDKRAFPKLDPSEIDTIVVPAREQGFREVFIEENQWYAIVMHASMIPKIKYIAAYCVAPISAITHVATVRNIEQWRDSNKYIVYFKEPAVEINPIKLVKNGRRNAPQSPRYTSKSRIDQASTLDEVF